MHPKPTFLLASLACVWAVCGVSLAESYHVSPAGDDSAAGTEDKPFQTISKAAEKARAGDTIFLREGVYREAVVLQHSGEDGRPIVLKNYPGERAVIQPGEKGKRPPGHGVLLQARQGYQKPIGWITLEGLEIRYGHDGVKHYNAHDVVIRDCHIHENWNQGILGNGNRVLIDRNVIAGNGTNPGERQSLMHGIYATGTAFTITNNVIHSNAAYGIQVAAYDYDDQSKAGPEYAEAKDWLIANNTLAFNKHSSGIVLWQDGVENCVVQNNVFYKNGGPNGIVFYSQEGRRHTVRNNIFYPPGENLASEDEDAYQASDNRDVDPRFVDADAFDFRLQSDSSAIDAGTAERAPATDIGGRPRPQGGKVDIGAYEFAANAGDAAAAPNGETLLTSAPPSDADAARHFDQSIAPLLARHCLECHDSTTKKGELDLSRREAFLAGGESGAVAAPGNADESLLWQYVEADLMPQDRPPLSDDQKRLLREWIDAGAAWSASGIIDASDYARNARAADTMLQRLTVPEYIETVRAAVGVDIERDARRLLPPDLRADGFSNTAYNLTVDLGHVQAYAELAQIIVDRMDVLAFAKKYTDSRELDRANMRRLIRRMGKWLLRGPLEKWEVDAYLGIAGAITEEGADFEEVAGCVVEAMLQSPRFIYRIEKQAGDGSRKQVGPYELASRMSYIVWGGPPDEELIGAADKGELADRDRVRAQVQRMLEDPRAIERSAQFIYEWLDLARLENLRPNPERFADWDDELASDMADETLAFFEDVAWRQNRPLVDLMNAEVTYVTPRLARFYGLDPTRDADATTAREFVSIASRIDDGLVALYTFKEGRGDRIRDVSGAGEPLDLVIEDTSAVAWRDGLTVNESALIATTDPPTRLIDAVKESNELTLEAWVTPADTSQSGPARMVTLSGSPNARNFTLGQDGDKFDVRFRSTRTDANGLPSLSTPAGTLTTRAVHVVFTRDATGRTRLYLDGEQAAAEHADGNLSNWDAGFSLALANELSKDRPWRGTFHRVAIYRRALSAEEVRSQGMGPSRYDLSDVPSRGGLLTHGSVLTVGGDEASMVSRGLFVLRDLLYGHVGDPPPCVDTTPVPTEPGISQRAIAEARLANGSCTGCHSKFEPFAFGLEKFDGLGAFHEEDEHGNGLRDDGEILIPGTDEPIRFESSAELMDILASSDRVRMNITRKLTQFAIGRPLVASDAPVVEAIHAEAQEGGGTYASLMTAIVMSDLVQKARTETVD